MSTSDASLSEQTCYSGIFLNIIGMNDFHKGFEIMRVLRAGLVKHGVGSIKRLTRESMQPVDRITNTSMENDSSSKILDQIDITSKLRI